MLDLKTTYLQQKIHKQAIIEKQNKKLRSLLKAMTMEEICTIELKHTINI